MRKTTVSPEPTAQERRASAPHTEQAQADHHGYGPLRALTDIQALQRTLGNRAVQRVLARSLPVPALSHQPALIHRQVLSTIQIIIPKGVSNGMSVEAEGDVNNEMSVEAEGDVNNGMSVEAKEGEDEKIILEPEEKTYDSKTEKSEELSKGKSAAWIGDVIIGGRTPSPFTSTMGAHSTAWVAHIDAVRRSLVNLPLEQAIDYLVILAEEELTNNPLRNLEKMIDDAHKEKLAESEVALTNSIAAMNAAKKPEEEIQNVVTKLRALINAYLTYVNYLPAATVKGGDPRGHAEGYAHGDLGTFEYVHATYLHGKKDMLEQLKNEQKLNKELTTEQQQEIEQQLEMKRKNELAQELQHIRSQGVAKDIKEAATNNFKGAEGADDDKLKTILIQRLWSLFAADAPQVFAAGKNDAIQLKVWSAVVRNFIVTIRRAYPYAFDFTEMHLRKNQEKGLHYALNNAKVTLSELFIKGLSQQLEGMRSDDENQEQAEQRDDHSEVAPSDVYSSGSRFQAIILLDDENKIGDIEMINRTPSPHSKTMGHHTTAWAAHLDAIRARLVGKSLHDALKTLQIKTHEVLIDRRLDLVPLLDEKHKGVLMGAYTELDNQSKILANMTNLEKHSKDLGGMDVELLPEQINSQVSFIENYIRVYLTYINYLPTATIAKGSIPDGRGEAWHLSFLRNYERYGNQAFQPNEPDGKEKRKLLRDALLGLYYKNALSGFPSPTDGYNASFLDEFSKDHPLYGKAEKTEVELRTPAPQQLAYNAFVKTVYEAYPKAATDSGLVGKSLDDDDSASAQFEEKTKRGKMVRKD